MFSQSLTMARVPSGRYTELKRSRGHQDQSRTVLIPGRQESQREVPGGGGFLKLGLLSDRWRLTLTCLCGRTSVSRDCQQVSGMLLPAQTVTAVPPAADAEHHMFHEGRSTCTGKQPTLDPRGLWCSQNAKRAQPSIYHLRAVARSPDTIQKTTDLRHTDQYAPASERLRQKGH